MPDAVLTAPASAAALSRNAFPDFFSSAAAAAARPLARSLIFGPNVSRSAFLGFPWTPSVIPALTSSSSAGLRRNASRFRAMRRPSD
jgi:hypothetical protein